MILKKFNCWLSPAMVLADIYLHSPRGSNNRVHEPDTTSENPFRLFFSNNDRRGGYNIGENLRNKNNQNNLRYRDQAAEEFFMSGKTGKTFKQIQFSLNRGFGKDEYGEKDHDNKVVVQFACQDDDPSRKNSNTAVADRQDMVGLRDGYVTTRFRFKKDKSESWIQDPQGLCYAKYIDDIGNYARVQHSNSLGECQNNCKNNKYLYASNHLPSKSCFCFDHLAGFNQKLVPGDLEIGEELDDHRNVRDNIVANKKRNTQRSMSLAADQNLCNQKCEGGEKCGGPTQNNQVHYLNIYRSGYQKEETQPAKNIRKRFSAVTGGTADTKGLHESWEAFDRCPLDKYPASFEQFYAGFECKFERENHPASSYNHKTMWNDIVIYSDASDCSFENFRVYECVEKWDNGQYKHKSIYNKRSECLENGGEWIKFYRWIDEAADIEDKKSCNALRNDPEYAGMKFVWGRPIDYQAMAQDQLPPEKCLLQPPTPKCRKSSLKVRPNVFSNNDFTHDWPTFDWEIPRFYSNTPKKCVMRVRHFLESKKRKRQQQVNAENQCISVDDKKLFLSRFNNGINKLASDGPTSDRNLQKMKKFYPKTVFQDRSHIFKLNPRPENMEEVDIQTISVRGKRCNIVQCFPAVEYDFVPEEIDIPNGRAVQFVWTGSNHHDNQNSQGNDGQAGAEGNGQANTDRNNVMQIYAADDSRNQEKGQKSNFPVPFENETLFGQAEKLIWMPEGFYPRNQKFDGSQNLENNEANQLKNWLGHATSGTYWCHDNSCRTSASEGELKNVLQLDNMYPNFVGSVFVPRSDSTFTYVSTRNSDFSNRSQKGIIRTGNGSNKHIKN